MPVVSPTTLTDAVEAMSTPGAIALAGGTDLVAAINAGRRYLSADLGDEATIVSLARVAGLSSWRMDDGIETVTIGAGVRWSALGRGALSAAVPALSDAARSLGSTHLRNAGTIGGSLAACSPASDGVTVLAALDADLSIVSVAGRRTLPLTEFIRRDREAMLAANELIESISLPILDGWQGYARVGGRRATATASVCVATDVATRSIRISLGSVAATVVRCTDAETLAADTVDWETPAISDVGADRCGRLAADASSPIDDHQSTAAYRRHAVSILVARLLRRGFRDDPWGLAGRGRR